LFATIVQSPSLVKSWARNDCGGPVYGTQRMYRSSACAFVIPAAGKERTLAT